MINSHFLSRRILIAGVTVACACVSLAYAHIRIAPVESTPGAREKYTIRVPNGWNIEFKKNEKGRIVGATWTGTLHPCEFIEFGMPGINPKEENDLVWRFVQYYEDGTTEECTGPVGSRLPSPVTNLKKPPSADPPPAASK